MLVCTDALRAIVSYSTSAEELLRRQKVHRGVIFQYLAEKGIIVSPQAEKAILITTVCQYWQDTDSANIGCVVTAEQVVMKRYVHFLTTIIH